MEDVTIVKSCKFDTSPDTRAEYAWQLQLPILTRMIAAGFWHKLILRIRGTINIYRQNICKLDKYQPGMLDLFTE